MKLKTLLIKHIRPCQGAADENLAKFSSVGLKVNNKLRYSNPLTHPRKNPADSYSCSSSHLSFGGAPTQSATGTLPPWQGGMVLLAIFVISFLSSSSTLAKPSTNYPSSITLTQDPAKVDIAIPKDGGIALGYQSLTITTNGATMGYNLTLANTNPTNASMVKLKLDSNGNILGQDSTKTIASVVGNNVTLGTNTYGYAIAKASDLTNDQINGSIWHEVPISSSSTSPATIAASNRETNEDDTVTSTTGVTYGVNLDTSTIETGAYQTTIQYTATVTPKPIPIDATVCRSGELTSACQVDIDPNMIPIKYTGSTDKPEWTAVTDPENETNPGEWYDYANKQWANAVTVSKDANYCAKATNDALEFFRNQHEKCSNPISTIEMYKLFAKYQNEGKPIRNMISGSAIDSFIVQSDDILGYWVYIPRYAYEVMRPNAVDKVVQPQNFDIKFETKGDIKKVPATSCNAGIKTLAQMWESGEADNVESNILAKDYRTNCGIDRTYPNNTLGKSETDQKANQNSDTTWATHPAFSWCKTTKADGTKTDCTELNGLWVAKFEVSGSTTAPTILPNQKSITSLYLGTYYDIAKSMGLLDADNTGGNNTATTQNNQNVTSHYSHMIKDSEWGAAAYLSASAYGAGVNNVQNNMQHQTDGTDGNGNTSFGLTGCGPAVIGDRVTTYEDGAVVDGKFICSTSEPQRSYNGTLGQSASTTGNIYGVYDMSGGSWEYAMGNLTTSNQQTTLSTLGEPNSFIEPAKPPYVDLLITGSVFGTETTPKKPEWSIEVASFYYNFDNCTWNSCGGMALHETTERQSFSNIPDDMEMWGQSHGVFAAEDYSWTDRGGGTVGANIFYAARNNGNTTVYDTGNIVSDNAFRAVMIQL